MQAQITSITISKEKLKEIMNKELVNYGYHELEIYDFVPIIDSKQHFESLQLVCVDRAG